MSEQCEPCKPTGTCLTFPLVFFSLGRGKSYTNDAMVFTVNCPTGPIQVTIPAGTINYTFPFPAGYDGEYPPLVLPCTGGVIIRTLASGSTQAQIDAVVNEMISTCAQQKANGSCPPVIFGNDQVFFVHNCAAGETLAYSGTLPSWITLDTTNSRLIGAAGTFTGASKTDANSAAQSALDTFGNAALASTALFCQPASSCIAQVATINAIPSGTQYALIPTYSAAHQRLLELDQITPAVNAIDTSTNTIAGSDVYLALGTGGCFAISQSEFYVADVGLSRFRVYSQNAVFSTNIATPDQVVACVYSAIQDRVYSLYFDGGGTGTSHLIAINPATHTIVTNTDTTVDYSLAVQLFNLKEQIAFVVPPDMFFYSIPGLTLNGSVNLGGFGFAGGACYATNADKILIGAFNTVTGFAEVWEIDPTTLAVGFKYSITPTNAGMFSLEYNSVTGLVIGKQTSGLMWVIDPMTQTIVCNVAGGTNENAVVDYNTGKVYTLDDGINKVLIFQ